MRVYNRYDQSNYRAEDTQMDIDFAITESYPEVDVPADQLVLKPNLGDQFQSAVEEKVGRPVNKERLMARLIYLRKRGMLPRLRRKI
jgi:hypothetical protein